MAHSRRLMVSCSVLLALWCQETINGQRTPFPSGDDTTNTTEILWSPLERHPESVDSRGWQNLANDGSRRRVMPEFMTIAEVAKLLKLGERTVYQLAREGRIGGAAKIGNQWRFEKDALLDWFKRGGEAQVTVSAAARGRSA
jgi:excisionase family DNA binding protein